MGALFALLLGCGVFVVVVVECYKTACRVNRNKYNEGKPDGAAAPL